MNILKIILFLALISSNAFSSFDKKTWKIGGMIHFEQKSGNDFIGAIELNKLTKKTIKQFFKIKSDTSSSNTKILIKKDDKDFVIINRESNSRPGIGEELHSTIIYTKKL